MCIGDAWTSDDLDVEAIQDYDGASQSFDIAIQYSMVNPGKSAGM